MNFIRFTKTLLIIDLILFFVAVTPVVIAQTYEKKETIPEVKKTVEIENQDKSKSVTLDSKDDSRISTTTKGTSDNDVVKKSVTADCTDCGSKDTKTTIRVAKPSVTTNVVEKSVPVSKTVIHENVSVEKQCFEEVGNSGVFTFCDGEDDHPKETTTTVVKGDNDTKTIIKENEDSDLPSTGQNSLLFVGLLGLLSFGILFKKYIFGQGFRRSRYETL